MRRLVTVIVVLWGLALTGQAAAETPGKPAADPDVVATLDSDDPLVLRGALAELADSDPTTIPTDRSGRLIAIALEGTDTKARELALQVLGRMGERVTGRSKLWPELANLLDLRRGAPPGRIRGWAAWTLGKTGAPVDKYGIVLLGPMSPYDDFARVAAADAFLSLGGDVPGFLRRGLAASPPGLIRANIIQLLGQVPVDEGGLTGAEARRLLEDAHRTERSALISIVLDRIRGTSEELAWLEDRLTDEVGHFELEQILARLEELGPRAAYLAPSVCQLIGRERAPRFAIYGYFEAVGPAPEAMCAIPRLENPEHPRAAAKTLLAMEGAGLAMLVKWMQGDDERAVGALVALAEAKSTPWPAFRAVLRATKSEDPFVRSAGASALPVFGNVGQFHLRRMLDDQDSWVRVTVIEELTGPGLQKLLLEQLSTRSGDVALAVVTRLGEIDGPLGPDEVHRAVLASGIDISKKLDLAEKLNRPLLPWFERLSSSDDPLDRLDAMHVARRLKESPDVDVVVAKLALLVDDPHIQVRDRAIRTLEGFGPASAPAVDALRSALLDPQWSVRSGAIHALGAIGPDAAAALPDLREMYESSRRPRSEVVEAIIQIGGMEESFISDFTATLDSGDSYKRSKAARMLGYAVGSESARAALRAVLKDPDEHVRWAAAKSLEKIGTRADQQRARAVIDDMGGLPPMRFMKSL